MNKSMVLKIKKQQAYVGRDTNSMPLFPIYQSDELPIQPPEHIRSLLWLCPEHSKSCHQDRCSLLVKCCFYVLQLTLRICPTDNSRVSAALLIRGYQRLDLCSDPVLLSKTMWHYIFIKKVSQSFKSPAGAVWRLEAQKKNFPKSTRHKSRHPKG